MELFFSPREFCSFSLTGCSANSIFFSFEEQTTPENGGGIGFLRISGEKYCGILRGKSKGETYFLGRLHGMTTFYDRKGLWTSKRNYFLGNFVGREQNPNKLKYF
ncbi:hypothetical protein C8_184 [Cannes 8 virus]|uniref:hypothetical protein n=1 Tax=Melbournevirus TaxID=1560514 RepID=UPI000392C163|nr:hypothetical protein MEL_157 [Melbournevirus]AGV01533.1 hypothetical protein C8_184 [Cannes 8 virus]AIT54770.1 hypothetical protein MEL_157 [Melbournevirus]